MTIDLRSDTVTTPTPEMLEAMFSAKVGDDVFDEDETVKALEAHCAQLFGMEAGLFCPSGTMTNQIALKALTRPYEEVICYEGAHIYLYEGGGIAGNSGLSTCLLSGNRGILSLEDIAEKVHPDNIHFPKTALVALENTVNKGGGSYYSWQEMAAISEFCQAEGLYRHLDGARIFNAMVATGSSPKELGQYFDTISICLSKGLGAPIGSVLLSSHTLKKQTKRIRKHMGGGMRQAGYLAAAGHYALEHHIDRLSEDHRRAKEIGDCLQGLPYVEEVLDPQTNIVIFKLAKGIGTARFLEAAAAQGILAVPFGKEHIRFVTHLDFTEEMLTRTREILPALSFTE